MKPVDYIRNRGFKEPLGLLGRISGFSAVHLRRIYAKDINKFNKILDEGIQKINSIYHIKTRRKNIEFEEYKIEV